MIQPIRPLTPRQEQIADAIGRGLSRREIAAELGMAVRTVDAHVNAIALMLPNPNGRPALRLVMLWVSQRRVRDASA